VNIIASDPETNYYLPTVACKQCPEVAMIEYDTPAPRPTYDARVRTNHATPRYPPATSLKIVAIANAWKYR
jgi:hypothetical protein